MGKTITGTPTLEIVTPLVAANMLTASKFNPRKIVMTEVLKHEKRLKSNRWFFTSDAVVIDDKNNVINGQTRLTAITRTGIGAQLIVMRGVPSAEGIEASVLAQDSGGRSRTLGQTLAYYKQPQCNEAASIIMQFGRYLTQTIPETKDTPVKTQWQEPFGRDKDVKVAIWKRYGKGTPELAAALRDLQSCQAIYGKRQASYGALSFAWRSAAKIGGDKNLATDVNGFFDELFNPDSSQVNPQILKTRDRIRRTLFNAKSVHASGGAKAGTRILAISVARAWNAWYLKEDLPKSTILYGGNRQTPLPYVHGITEAAAAWLATLEKAYGGRE
jgi:hypothetical protein